ncbi:hypothetical protein HanHA300_Chr03g0085601 [Helianthus annuus]|nr:hypothetical protein HanHA300_Chr03g0085601 [Helianthus annuus]KAJ0600051.1 hypothetical protein HanIR_Chr03g0112171 [Helianthus annuus]KAJ0607473.1 hypothetical protein HanHA89_Chr03g0097161 [Helianthus annuus]KAJ0767537.1 hypothetical protein HanLR1_Chr03g0090521 [Helianthus annuus]
MDCHPIGQPSDRIATRSDSHPIGLHLGPTLDFYFNFWGFEHRTDCRPIRLPSDRVTIRPCDVWDFNT